MNNERRTTIHEEVELLAAREEAAARPAGKALEGARQQLDDVLVAEWNAAVGADPMIDKALKELRQRAGEVEAAVEEVRLTRRDVRLGRADHQHVETVVAESLEREKARTEDVVARARKAVEVGQERLVRELLPEPARGPLSAEAKADLALMVKGFKDPREAFEYAMAKALAADDRAVLGLLAGPYGENLYRSLNGTVEGYKGLRKRLLTDVAGATSRRSPRSAEARKWGVALGNAAKKYVDGESFRTSAKIADVLR